MTDRQVLERKVPDEVVLAAVEEEETEAEGRRPGRQGRKPHRLKHAAYLKTMRDVATLDEWQAIVKRAVTQAKQGNHQARKWLSDYLLGPPVQRIAPTTPDGKESYTPHEIGSARHRLLGIITRIIDSTTTETVAIMGEEDASPGTSSDLVRLAVLGKTEPTASDGSVDNLADSGRERIREDESRSGVGSEQS